MLVLEQHELTTIGICRREKSDGAFLALSTRTVMHGSTKAVGRKEMTRRARTSQKLKGTAHDCPEAYIQQHLLGKLRGAARAEIATAPVCHQFYLFLPFYPLYAYIPWLVRNPLAGRTHYCLP